MHICISVFTLKNHNIISRKRNLVKMRGYYILTLLWISNLTWILHINCFILLNKLYKFIWFEINDLNLKSSSSKKSKCIFHEIQRWSNLPSSSALAHGTQIRSQCLGLPGGPVVKTLPSNAGRADLIPAWGAKIPQPKNK